MSSMTTLNTGVPAIRLQAEEIEVSRRSVAGDTLRVKTVTREREHHVNEDLSHVRVEVKRVPIERPIDAIPSTREEGDTTIMSVVEEIIVVERRLILKEEVHIRRVHVTEHHEELVVVREQGVEISRVGAASPALCDEPHPLAAAAIPTLQE
jgi:stress response protein YsnF